MSNEEPRVERKQAALEFTCCECGEDQLIIGEKFILDLLNTQRIAETQQLYCRDCAE